MADTVGLVASRAAWTAAVEAGETELPHDKWYEEQVKAGKESLWTQAKKERAAKKETEEKGKT